MQATNADPEAVSVLISSGLDSAILIHEVLRSAPVVHPIFVRSGFVWEGEELEYLHRYLAAIRCDELKPLTVLEVPVADLHPNHWGFTARNVPAADSADDAVFLPGRNLLLLSKAMLWCHLHGVGAVAIGVLGTNPFPDATPAFFGDLERVVNLSVGGKVRILTPFGGMTKREVMELGRGLPLEHSFSCIDPQDGRHCGRCNKCEERIQAFRSVGMPDPTIYASVPAASNSITR